MDDQKVCDDVRPIPPVADLLKGAAPSPRCENCFFARAAFGNPNLECRHDMPTVFLMGVSRAGPQLLSTWPSVQKTHWCGKHQPKSMGEKVL